jgi:hypothetical protein
MRAANKPYVVTWSWPVFLTIFAWHFYRKMYLIGAILILMQFVLVYSFGIYGFVAFAGLATSGKTQYVLSAMKRLEKAEALGIVGNKRQDYLRRAGGVSVLAGALAGTFQGALAALTIYGLYLMIS